MSKTVRPKTPPKAGDSCGAFIDETKAKWNFPLWQLTLITALVLIGVAGGGAAMTDLGPWYQKLVQPPWKPPDPWFGPIWTVLYIAFGAAFVLTFRSAPNQAAQKSVVLVYLLNCLFNFLWSFIYFFLKRPDWAFYEWVFLCASLIAVMFVSARIRPGVLWLLFPYLIWLVIAGALNYQTIKLNPDFS